MTFKETELKGVYIIELESYEDSRGFFSRNFCKKEFTDAGLDFDIKQINIALTKQQGTLRGMHYQKAPKLEDKIVQCLQGKIFDVVLDLRPGSPTHGKWASVELEEGDQKMILVPANCAHGMQTLTDNCLIQYFLSEFYVSELYGGARWNDPAFNIEWPITHPTLLSDKDKNWPLVHEK